MKHLLWLFVLLMSLWSCQQPPLSPLAEAADYFPPTEQLERGIVNKYYLHFKSKDGYERTTDISYWMYQLNKEGQLVISGFNAAYEPSVRTITEFRNGAQVVVEQEQFWRGDSFPVQLQEQVLLNWVGDTALYQSTTSFPGEVVEEFELRQTGQLDSLAEGRKLKIFEKERARTYRYSEREDRHFSSQIRETYAEGLGLFYRKGVFEEGELTAELVEQMPAVTFRKKQAAAPKRVAYIDPASVLDKGTDFEPCQDYIYDYYNGDPDAGPKGGKRALWTLFGDQLNTDLLAGQSGYLTFRFVINCEGQAGYFVTEEAALDFKHKRFSDELIQHVFGILATYDSWRPTTIRGEQSDAYAYITLKIEDGELIEILP